MATLKQRKALENMVENGGNASKAMRDAGYSPATAENPDKLTESKGFKELADEIGLTDNFIAQALYDDIKAKPKDRAKELGLAIKVRGLEKSALDITSDGEKMETGVVVYIPKREEVDGG